MEGLRPPGIRPGRRCAVDFSLEPGSQRVVCGLIWPRPASGRHQTSTQLPNNLFPDLGACTYLRHVDRVQCQAAAPELLIVTTDAIFIENRPWRHGNARRRD